jgi:Rrf2 family protein
MLSMKAEYGLEALADLARHPAGTVMQSREIAEAHAISKKFLDSILAELRVADILTSRKGPGGGFALALPASEIFVGRVVRVLDGPLAPIACASRTAYVPCADCKVEAACAVRRTMLEVRDAIAAVLDATSLADFIAQPASAAA